jgi:hypothetical protein
MPLDMDGSDADVCKVLQGNKKPPQFLMVKIKGVTKIIFCFPDFFLISQEF